MVEDGTVRQFFLNIPDSFRLRSAIAIKSC